jgi:hypothetical protein
MGGPRYRERIPLQFNSTRTRRASSALAALLAIALSGCGGMSLEPDVPAGVNLAGSWHLNREASDDPEAIIARLQEKLTQRMSRMREYTSDDLQAGSSETGNRGGATDARPAGATAMGGGFRDRRRHRDFLRTHYGQALGARLSGNGLVIEQSTSSFVISRGDSRRSYTPGGHSVVSVVDGVADQSSGWKGREFVIDVRPQVGPRLTERYGLTADGQLVEKVTLAEDNGLPELEFTRVYEPGAAPVRSLPTSN